MTEGGPTLARIEATRADLAPLARLHRVLAEASRDAGRSLGDAIVPAFPGVPALHWIEGRSLLDAADAAALALGAARLFGVLADAAAGAFPQARDALAALAARAADAEFPWRDRVASFREPAARMPHGALFRFLLLRTMSVPARRLAETVSAPHASRWIPAKCPWCGVPAAASIARQGSGRTLICVLCAGRWEREGLECLACGEERQETRLVLADRALGPASLEGCATCRRALKVFAPADLEGDAPADALLALEVLTVHLDVLGEREHLHRDEVALAAVYPPP